MYANKKRRARTRIKAFTRHASSTNIVIIGRIDPCISSADVIVEGRQEISKTRVIRASLRIC